MADRTWGTNPFTPTFGVTPPRLAGRDPELAAFVDALDEGPGAPGRATLFTGPRGSGKTVMLNAVEDLAKTRGWLVISQSTRPGVAEELATSDLPALLAYADPEEGRSEVTSVSVSGATFGGGVTRTRAERHPRTPTLRSQLAELTDLLRPNGTGVLITLDEVHRAALTDLRVIAQAVQHAFREGRDVAFAAAGLPAAVDALLRDDVLTFLRRAERVPLRDVSDPAVDLALHDPVLAAGRTMGDEALAVAAHGTHGYPFLVQLVGHAMWDVDRTSRQITAEHARRGVASARRRVGRLVHEPALADLSAVDRAFLDAMALDDGPTRMGDIAVRLGVSAGYASQYRLRLIATALIAPAGYGRVDFAVPYLREYLRKRMRR